MGSVVTLLTVKQLKLGEAENTANNSPSKAAQVNIGANGGLGEKDQTSQNSSVDNIVKECSTNFSVDTQNQNPPVNASESNASDTSVDASQFAMFLLRQTLKIKIISILFTVCQKRNHQAQMKKCLKVT